MIWKVDVFAPSLGGSAPLTYFVDADTREKAESTAIKHTADDILEHGKAIALKVEIITEPTQPKGGMPNA